MTSSGPAKPGSTGTFEFKGFSQSSFSTTPGFGSTVTAKAEDVVKQDTLVIDLPGEGIQYIADLVELSKLYDTQKSELPGDDDSLQEELINLEENITTAVTHKLKNLAAEIDTGHSKLSSHKDHLEKMYELQIADSRRAHGFLSDFVDKLDTRAQTITESIDNLESCIDSNNYEHSLSELREALLMENRAITTCAYRLSQLEQQIKDHRIQDDSQNLSAQQHLDREIERFLRERKKDLEMRETDVRVFQSATDVAKRPYVPPAFLEARRQENLTPPITQGNVLTPPVVSNRPTVASPTLASPVVATQSGGFGGGKTPGAPRKPPRVRATTPAPSQVYD